MVEHLYSNFKNAVFILKGETRLNTFDMEQANNNLLHIAYLIGFKKIEPYMVTDDSHPNTIAYDDGMKLGFHHMRIEGILTDEKILKAEEVIKNYKSDYFTFSKILTYPIQENQINDIQGYYIKAAEGVEQY